MIASCPVCVLPYETETQNFPRFHAHNTVQSMSKFSQSHMQTQHNTLDWNKQEIRNCVRDKKNMGYPCQWKTLCTFSLFWFYVRILENEIHYNIKFQNFFWRLFYFLNTLTAKILFSKFVQDLKYLNCFFFSQWIYLT